MKKIVIRLLAVLVILMILAALAVHFFLDAAVKRGVETIGPKLTEVDVKLASVNISVLSGSGKIKGLVIGNPEGYKTPSAINIGAASLSLKPTSVLSEKIIITSLKIEDAEINFEGGLGGNNVSKILSSVKASSSSDDKSKTKENSSKPAKKFQVDELLITGVQVHVTLTGGKIGGLGGTLPLPEIHLKDLGKDGDGITAGELTDKIVSSIYEKVAEAVGSYLSIKGVEELGKKIGKGAGDLGEKATKGLGDLLKKKE